MKILLLFSLNCKLGSAKTFATVNDSLYDALFFEDCFYDSIFFRAMIAGAMSTAKMNVPFIDLARFEEGFLEDLLAKQDYLNRNTQFVGGPEVQSFEERILKYAESKYVVSCGNGTDALQLSLRACDVGPGDNVLVVDLNFWAAFEAIVNVGANPITVDVDSKHLHLSLQTLDKAVSLHKPKALVLVHLYGWADQETTEIREYCSKRDIKLIEDCAQSIGTRFKSESLIGGADIATTSFYPAKVLGASGDAGAVFCQDYDTAKKVRQLANHGRADHYDYDYVGWNSRMGAGEAGFLNLSMEHLPTRIRSRRKAIGVYREELKNSSIQVLEPCEEVYENGYIAIARLAEDKREKLKTYLNEKTIGFGVVYPTPLHATKAASANLYSSIDDGNTERICKEVICLPCFAYMKDEELEYVVEALKAFS